MSSPRPGQIVGDKYRIVKLLGAGGMGAVYEAENTAIGGNVAIKWLHAHRSVASDRVDRLHREARASARVRHPNVVDLYDIGRDGSAMFLVMELMHGETLASVLDRLELPVPVLLSLLIPAMRGVAEAHRQGIIHRDIKPENIFLARELDRDEPVPKVLDFGIAKMGAVGGGTAPGFALGTPQFMSLEQLRAVRDLDARADVYAFGVILYLALTGRPPFSAQNIAHLVVTLTTTTPIAPHLLEPRLPVELSAAIMRAIAVNRDQRTPNLEQLVRELVPFASKTLSGVLVAQGGREQPRWSAQIERQPAAVTVFGVTHRLTVESIGGSSEGRPARASAATSVPPSAPAVMPSAGTPSPPSRTWSFAVASGAALILFSLGGVVHLLRSAPSAALMQSAPKLAQPVLTSSPLPAAATPESPTPAATPIAAAPAPMPATPTPTPAPTPTPVAAMPAPAITGATSATVDAGLAQGSPMTAKPRTWMPAPAARRWVARPWNAAQLKPPGQRSPTVGATPGQTSTPLTSPATAATAPDSASTAPSLASTALAGAPIVPGGAAPAAAVTAAETAAAPPEAKSDLTAQDAAVRRGVLQICEFVGNCPQSATAPGP